jgi:hypothetical protein
MQSKNAKSRMNARRREAKFNKMRNAGSSNFYPCKRYDGDGNLIEEISIDDQMKLGQSLYKGNGFWPKYSKTMEPSLDLLDRTVARMNRQRKNGKATLVKGLTAKRRV